MKVATTRKEAVVELLSKPVPAGTSTWRPAKSLVKLRSQVDARWPGRKRSSDGIIGDASHQSRDSDHNPWVKDGVVGVVTAIDITHDPQGGCDAERVVSALIASRDPRIKYIIWNKRIISSSVASWVWRSYSGRNPHTQHFHLSVASTKSLYDHEGEWNLVV